MTPQEHIDAIGSALHKMEVSIDAQEETVREAKRLARRLHKALDRAQKAYAGEQDGNVIVLYSTADAPGGTSKPDDGDPDEPVEP